MSEFEVKEFEVPETTVEQVYPEEQQYSAEPTFDYPEQMESSTNSAALIAGVFTAGAAVGAVTTKLIGKVKAKIAEKKGNEPPVKIKKKLRCRSMFYLEDVPVETGNNSPAENSAETPVEETETK